MIADEALNALTSTAGSAQPARLWPHHFDIARLFVLQVDKDEPEASKSVGLGMTPGDGGIAQPYFYATPWPYPKPQPTPALAVGRWNTEGWYGAVLEADHVASKATVSTFLNDSMTHLVDIVNGGGSHA